MNIFRIGLNLIVVVVLHNIESMKNESVFLLCIMLLITATLCQHYLHEATSGTKEEQAEMMAELQGQEAPEIDEGDDLDAAEDGTAANSQQTSGKGD